MALTKSHAVILRSIKYGESSRILTAYSKERGILEFVAKGVRSRKSKLAGVLEPLNSVEVVYYDKPNRDLQTLSQASLLFTPFNVRADYDITVLAMAACELVAKLEVAEHANEAVYALLTESLEAMDRVDDRVARILFLSFQLKIVAHQGFDPGIEGCENCQAQSTQKWYYHIRKGLLLCDACCQDDGELMPLSGEGCDALRTLLHTSVEQLSSFELSGRILASVYRFITKFNEYHLPEIRKLKTLEVLKETKLFTEEIHAGKVDP